MRNPWAYEVAVVAALLQFGALFPEVEITSDGGLWLVGLDICQHLFKQKAVMIPETIALEDRWALPAPYRSVSVLSRNAVDDA